MTKVKDLMTTDVRALSPDDTVKEAAEMMAALDIRLVPVAENGYLLGTLVDRELVLRSTAAGRDPRNQPVKAVMNRDSLCCREDQDVDEARALMEREGLRRLPVVGAGNRMTGILKRADLEEALAR